VTSSNGYDIVFASDPVGAAVLPFEQDTYNATTGAVNYWVQVPVLSHTTDTVIYMFYGNSAVTTDQSNKTGVWDSNYRAVWHLSNGTTLTANDSTSGGHNGSLQGSTTPTAVSGKIDGGAGFNGSSAYIDVAGSTSLEPATAITISGWTNYTTINSFAKIYSRPYRSDSSWSPPYTSVDLLASFSTTGKPTLEITTGGGQTTVTGATAINDGNWHYVVGTYDGSNIRVYQDGQQSASAAHTGTLDYSGATTADVALGSRSKYYNSDYMNGNLDEIRLSSIARSSDWISTEYNNQNSPSSFYGLGAANPPAIVSLSPTSGPTGTTVKITGARFGSTQGTSTVAFDGTAASPSSWSDTGIIVPVPTGANSGNVVVTVSGGSSNPGWFTVPGPLPYGYGYQSVITIDHTKVPNTDQTDFPVLISGTYSYLATNVNGGNVTNSSGYDIIFTSDAAGINKLDHEIDSYNPVTGAVNFWVRIPTVSHTVDTVIYMFYANPSVTTSQENKPGVWKNNYLSVYHLGNGTTVGMTDSGSAGYNLSGSATAATGKIGGGVSFNGNAGTYLNYESVSAYPSGTSPVTLEAWFQLASTSSQEIFGYGANSANGSRAALSDNGTSATMEFENMAVSASQSYDTNWHHLVGVYNGGALTTGSALVYLDGVLASNAASGGTPNITTNELKIGGIPTVTFCCGMNGSVDEVRVSSGVRSADWIATEYNNQSSPSTFYSTAPANPPPTISSLSATSAPVGTSITISGAFFGSTQGSSTVTFGGVTASPTSWSASSIAVPVPSGATSGNVVVTVSGLPSNPAWFTMPGSLSNGSGYSYWRRITLSHTKVPNTDQINFPVLVSGTYSYLATTSNGGNVTSANGYDIIFASDPAGENLLAFEQESYSATTGAVNYWVKVPALSHSTDTAIYMFYGNRGVTTDQSNKTGVWDSNYVGVWHLPNSTTLTANDSTSNGNNGKINGATPTNGEIDGAASFNGSNQYITVNTQYGLTTKLTFSGWVKFSSLSGSQDILGQNTSSWTGGNAAFYFQKATDGSPGCSIRPNSLGIMIPTSSSGCSPGVYSSNAVSAGTWYHVAGTYDGSTISLYINGSLAGLTSRSGAIGTPTGNMNMGSGYSGGSVTDYLSGIVDEVRISNVARSADWIAAEYNTESNSSTFYSIGGSNPPTITNLSATSGVAGTSVTITGTRFGSTQGTSTVTFNGTTASPSSWSDTGIIVPVPTGAISGNVVVTVGGTASNPAWFTVFGTWTNQYGYQRMITIDHTKVPNTDQTNFPVLISGTYSYLATTGNGGNVTSSTGYDIIFTSDAAGINKLDHEIDSYNPVTGTASFWVRIPTLSHTSDIAIFLWYGNALIATSQENVAGVWSDGYVGYVGVRHFSASSTLTSDSTGNNALTNQGMAATTGQIGGGALGTHSPATYMNETSGVVNLPSGTAPRTLGFWFKFDTLPSGYYCILTQYGASSAGAEMAVNQYTDGDLYLDFNSVNQSLTWSKDTNWHYFAGVLPPGSANAFDSLMYLDGAQKTRHFGTNGSINTNPTQISINAIPAGTSACDAVIDEWRISNVARSADWITTEYNNESSPSTFSSTGPANLPSISSLSATSAPVGTSITISGAFFGSTQGSSTVTFGGVTASPTSWSASSIAVPVPSGATSGNIVVTVSGLPSNPVWFTVPGTGYTYRRTITIAHAKVSNTDQTNFPVLIAGTYSYLATISNGGNVTSSNGYDIVFASDPVGAAVLPFEQDTYNATTGAVNYWVQVPVLSHTTDTVIYMFYGNSAVTTDQSNKTGVWDSNYRAVWHLSNGTTLTANDSTSGGHNGSLQGSTTPTAVSGKIDGGAGFNGSSAYIDVAGSTSLEPATAITISGWTNYTTINSFAKIYSRPYRSDSSWSPPYTSVDLLASFSTTGKPTLEITTGGGQTTVTGATAINDGNWHYVVGTYDGSNIRVYQDGQQSASAAHTGTLDYSGATTADVALGSRSKYYNSDYMNGNLDEIRLSSIARSSDWISTEYNNQGSPSTFYSVSLQVDLVGPMLTSLSPTSGSAGTSVTLSGAGFGPSQGTSTVTFNGTVASPTSWSSTSIAAPVPSGATTGNIVVTVSGIPSNLLAFTVKGGLSGTVTRQSDGTAVSGATVQVLLNRAVLATTTTASNGTYSVTNLGTGEYDVKFSASGFGTVLQSAVTVSASGATLNQVLATPGTISGKVTQSNGITAISGASVTVLQNSEPVATATTDGSGNYSASSLSAGSYEVEVSASGFVNQGLTSVSVTTGNTTTENFSLNAVGTQPISYVYDQLGRLTATVDQGGNVAGYAYDSVGNILSISRGSAQHLSVISFSPNTGSVGSTVTIYGTAFSSTPSQNTVKFNGTAATVTSAAVTSLVVSIPSGATTGTVSVTTSAGTATSTASFTVTTSGAGQPTISSFTPSIGTPGTSVSISGTNFDTTTANDKVKFNIAPSRTSSATTTSLSVSVPSPATSGHLVVATPAGTASSTSDLFVPPSPFTASSVGYTNRMSLGGNLTVTVSTAGQIGLVVFDGTAGHRVSLLTSSDTMTSTGGATAISINRPDGPSVVTQTVTTSAPFIAAQSLSITGTYTIVVQPSSSATGSITIAIYDVPADVKGSITIGGSSVGVTTTTPGQAGALTFSGTSGQLVTVHVTSNSFGSVTVSLLSPNGELVTSLNSSSSSFNLSSVTLPATGTFAVAISPSQANTGSITIQLTSP